MSPYVYNSDDWRLNPRERIPRSVFYAIGDMVVYYRKRPCSVRAYTVSCETIPNLAKTIGGMRYISEYVGGAKLEKYFPLPCTSLVIRRSKYYLHYLQSFHRLKLTPLPLAAAKTLFAL
jgi:hypothetical protein